MYYSVNNVNNAKHIDTLKYGKENVMIQNTWVWYESIEDFHGEKLCIEKNKAKNMLCSKTPELGMRALKVFMGKSFALKCTYQNDKRSWKAVAVDLRSR